MQICICVGYPGLQAGICCIPGPLDMRRLRLNLCTYPTTTITRSKRQQNLVNVRLPEQAQGIGWQQHMQAASCYTSHCLSMFVPWMPYGSHDSHDSQTSAAKELTKQRRRAPNSFPSHAFRLSSGSRNEVSLKSLLIGNTGKTILGICLSCWARPCTPKVNALPLQSVHSLWMNGGAKATACGALLQQY